VSESDYEISSGNVFADLGFAEPEEELVRAELAHRIATIIEDRRLTPATAAALLSVDEPGFSALVRGHLEGFSWEQLARYLAALGQDVEIVVRPARDAGHVRVRAAG
jgi:predicted XRE-type DNA-binding protein